MKNHGKTERKQVCDRAERVPAQIPVTVNGSLGVTKDISATGVSFEFDEHHAVGSKITFQIDFETPGGALKLNCDGEVVRVENFGQKIGIGVKILNQNLS